MKKIILVLAFTITVLGVSPLIGQQLNGQNFTFNKGKNEWSDTIYKKLLTKKMAKEGRKSVLLAIRYKFDRKVEEGNWFQIEITNKSKETKIKFNVASSHNQEVFTVKLNPSETKIFKKLYYHQKSGGLEEMQDNDDNILISPFEEILQNRE
jgi:hypothetical protein